MNLDQDFLLISPLPHRGGPEVTLAPGLAIRPLAESEREALASFDASTHLHGLDTGDGAGHWAAYEFENPHEPDNVRHRRRREAAFKTMRDAMYAAQILHPAGASNVFLLFRRETGGWQWATTEHRQPFLPTAWSRRCPVAENFAADLPPMLARIRKVFHLPVLRLQIPVWLLEQGLAAPDPHIRILLWATGLDSLTRASGQANFRDRLGELLGSEMSIFPPDADGCHPAYTVSQVAGHLYELRNELAHGLPFHEMFRRQRGFLNAAGQPVSPEFAKYRYDHVLEECALFLLTRTLREVLLRNLVYDIHMMEWREPD